MFIQQKQNPTQGVDKNSRERPSKAAKLEEDIFGLEDDDELSDYELPEEEEEEDREVGGPPTASSESSTAYTSYDTWPSSGQDVYGYEAHLEGMHPGQQPLPDQDAPVPSAPTGPSVTNEARLRFEEAREFMDSVEKEVRGTGKRKRRQPTGDHDLTVETKQDRIARRVVEKMQEAADQDERSVQAGKPATEKLLLLEIVVRAGRKAYLHPALMDAGIVKAIKDWLEPNSKTRALPTMDVQSEMMHLLDELPVETDHLHGSGIGRLIKFYATYRKVSSSIRVLAEKLIAKWSRPILGKSDDYRTLARHRAYGEEGSMQQHIPTIEPKSGYEPKPGEPGYSVKARIPIHFAPTYNVAPETDPSVMAEVQSGRSIPKNEQRTRLTMIAKGRKYKAKE
ncbi:hypothetical protein BJ684DRAFT_15631 [Piptocephalis cylindrospora]|uniref:TFIIS N-terminal domain-containing protein n=1 Tax=Piptocephalis cylindrospora TaxID=1907219 RepID=A0A4P9Y523_9FUNG|nr:hypothetical protein BJ684DRAFT_15631 [Piptocephalis cylindrospora]|eukprot:RKP14013.1 hypothetical protein BJ684DRAFT_15631 [Piptocephalis cylindrospora]